MLEETRIKEIQDTITGIQDAEVQTAMKELLNDYTVETANINNLNEQIAAGKNLITENDNMWKQKFTDMFTGRVKDDNDNQPDEDEPDEENDPSKLKINDLFNWK